MRALVSLGLKQATAHAFVSIAEDRLHEKLAVPVLKNLPDFHLGSAWRFARLCMTNITKIYYSLSSGSISADDFLAFRAFLIDGVRLLYLLLFWETSLRRRCLSKSISRSINKCPWLFLPGTKVCSCMSGKFVFCCLFRERVIDCCRTAFC